MIQRTALNFFLAFAVGAGITLFVFVFLAGKIIHAMQSVSNAMNKKELSLALELYYSDHNVYPAVSGGALFAELATAGYLKGGADGVRNIQYTSKNNGQEYSLEVR